MATEYTTPGVYIEEDASLALSVSNAATAIPVFIGRFSPKDGSSYHTFRRVSSWLDFTNKYYLVSVGQVEIESKAPEGEETKWTYSVKNSLYSSSSLALQLYFQNGGGACYICSVESASDSAILASLPEKIEQAGDIRLLVCTELDSEYKTAVYSSILTLLQDAEKTGYFLIADSDDGKAVTGISGSAKAAAYYPTLKTVLKSGLPEDKDVVIKGYKTSTTEPETVKNLVDLKAKDEATYTLAVAALGREFEQKANLVAPSVVLAGVYGATDASRGVWKAPANVSLNGINGVTDLVSDEEQGDMNKVGINVIRYFSDRGYVVWGARTLDTTNIDWRYIPVRRLFNAVEVDVKQAMHFAIFEPNNQPTWEKVRAAISSYLYRLWEQGAFAGNSAEEAFFVQIGKGITMTDDDINQGKMVVKVGLAPVRPAEFIILEFTQNVTQ